VRHVEIMRDNLGKSKGCALVHFASAKDAEAAMVSLKDSDLKGRLLYIREDRTPADLLRASFLPVPLSRKPVHPSTICQCFVGNLAVDVTWLHLKNHFLSMKLVWG
jgi:hypothetical protein